ncbi:MAG: histidine phosphatase family protein [Pseudomonadota bacterium]
MIFLRHPRPDVKDGTCYGRLDLDIHADGHDQIARAVESTPRVVKILASPALRCRKLALSLAERDGLEPQFDERLLEMHMGDWEGMLWKDIPREHSEPWLRDPFNLPCPGGESFRQVQLRVVEAMEDVTDDTAIVCHAGPIRALQMAWTGVTFQQAFAQAPSYAEPIILRPEKQQE